MRTRNEDSGFKFGIVQVPKVKILRPDNIRGLIRMKVVENWGTSDETKELV